MFGFARKPTKADLQGHKTVIIGGMKFTIRRLSPLIDFATDRMPMVFSDTTRLPKQDLSNPAIAKRILDDMHAVVQAGVVDPPLATSGKPDLNVADIFRDPEIGNKLYIAIMEHSLIRLNGLRLPFFFLVRLLLRFIIWLKSTVNVLVTWSSRGRNSA